jgi:hypothetical protein
MPVILELSLKASHLEATHVQNDVKYNGVRTFCKIFPVTLLNPQFVKRGWQLAHNPQPTLRADYSDGPTVNQTLHDLRLNSDI